MTDQIMRDDRGRWRRGRSGNPAGRSKGSRNRWRRADPARAVYWKASEWRLHFARSLQAAEGDFEQRRAAAFAECLGLWQALNPSYRPCDVAMLSKGSLVYSGL
jgi:hypothetical protein